jgi:NAD(P)-dependent dehydrogenase (short-subunit alcohol dehydrogenase family)
MEKFLAGKTALVTGATRGIGRAIAQQLAEAGAAVAICARNASEAEQTARDLSTATAGDVRGRAADVSDWNSVASLFGWVEQQFSGLDILVNNAGVGIFRSVADLSLMEWRSVVDINLSGVFYCSHHAIPLFRKRGGGFVVNISSLAGKNPFAGGAAYNASKFGVNGFSEAMMQDHRYDNVRVSYVMPGSVDTDFGGHSARSDWKIAPEDVADIVLAILRLPERTLVSRVEVRPSRPKK